MGDVDAAAFGGHVVLLDVVEGTSEAGVPQAVKEQQAHAHHAPDQIIKVQTFDDFEAEKTRPGNAENAVGAAGETENIVDERNAHYLHNAYGHNKQVVAPQMNDGTGHHQGHHSGGRARQGHDPEHGPMVDGIENGRRIGPHGKERRVPHVEDAGLPQNDVEGKGQQGVEADAHADVQPVGVADQGQSAEQDGRQNIQPGRTARAHSFSAVRSPKSPVGRTMRMRISTTKAMASFQAMAM